MIFDRFMAFFDYLWTFFRVFSVCRKTTSHTSWHRNLFFENMIFRNISRDFFSVFRNFDFWPFYGPFSGIVGSLSGIFCLLSSYSTHPMTQEPNFFKNWSLRLYQETVLFVFRNCWVFWTFSGIFCPWTSYRTYDPGFLILKILYLGLYQEIFHEILIPERSSTPRRCTFRI